MKRIFCNITMVFLLSHTIISAQFVLQPHKKTDNNVIAVTGPGSYGEPGTTYLLSNNITSARSANICNEQVTKISL
ncbi:MAG: hypothetical protein ABI760_01055 [Ferruginibacter sp.]